MNDRVWVFIDGGNFHHLVIKKINCIEQTFDFEKFVSFLVGEKSIGQNGKRYYVGTVRERMGDAHSKESMAIQTRFFATLKNNSWHIGTSKLKTRIETITVDSRMKDFDKLKSIGIREIEYERKREKGIDVMIATDIIAGAVEDKYDTAIVISSDADLLPAIDWVRKNRNKKVQYVGFSMPDSLNERNSVKPLLSMMSKTNAQRILTKEDMMQFIIEPVALDKSHEPELEITDTVFQD
ncbi:MAG: NYN domain-containing protein [Bacteroidetes bacterium]|nr:NYN domain-containing protein [Bacteroidota bacterium]